MPADITRGIAAITWAKKELREVKAGLRTDVAFTCITVDARFSVLISNNSTLLLAQHC
jgi:hypothetical protein